jgi:beta-1,4-N-acetylglucosaminyltransferase
MIFLTVGTQFPFDRLVKAIDVIVGKGLINEEIFGQIGEGAYKPQNFQTVAFLEKNIFDDHLKNASGVIGHAGMGTIRSALEYNKPLLVMPRLSKYHEVVHDHQVAIAKKFEEQKHILVAYQKEDLPQKAMELKHFVPTKRKTQVEAVVQRILDFLQQENGNN